MTGARRVGAAVTGPAGQPAEDITEEIAREIAREIAGEIIATPTLVRGTEDEAGQ